MHTGSAGQINNTVGDLLLDVAGDITLDADGGDVKLSDGGTEFGRFTKNGNDFELRSIVTNGDFKIIGERTAGTVNAMTIDMSDGGAVSFNSKIISNTIQLEAGFISQTSGDLTIDVAGYIKLDSDGGFILFEDGGTQFGYIENSSTDLVLGVNTQDKDIIFKGNDGGSTINALKLDMSNNGRAIFNAGAGFSDHVFFSDNAKAVFGGGDDLQIYHDGSDSYIQDAGTGDLKIKATTIRFLSQNDVNETMMTVFEEGAVNLMHNGSTKFSTTSTGINVTGTVVADGLTVDSLSLIHI